MIEIQIIEVNMKKDELIEYYKKERVTGDYDKQREKTEYRKNKRRKELKIFLRLLNKKSRENVLEIGCSSGFLTEYLGYVTAIDTSTEMLKFAKQKNPKAKVIEADMFELPFINNYFDKIVTMRVWNHLNEKELRKALRESKRVLKKDGILVFDMEEKNWLRRFIHFFYKRIFGITGFKIYQYSLKEMCKILREEKFKLNKWETLNHHIGNQIIWKIKSI